MGNPNWGIVSLIVSSVLLCYWNSFYCDLVFDDISAIKDNKDLRPNTPISNLFINDFWGTSMSKEHSHKSYRPVTVLTFRANYYFHGAEAFGYHVVNVLLHALVSCLYYKLCRTFIVASKKASVLASILFAVHPVHTEAVTGVVGRAELLSSVFFILALLTYKKSVSSNRITEILSYLLLTGIWVALAMFSKEQGITVLGVCFAYDLPVFLFNRSKKRHALLRVFFLVVFGLILIGLRFKVMGSTLPIFTTFDNPASYEDSPIRQLTWSYLLAVNSWLLLSPSELCCDWTMGTVPLIKSLSDLRNLGTLSFFVIFGHLGITSLIKKSNQRTTLLCLALIGLPFLPASNLFFPVGFVLAERVLYIPSMGFCLLISFGYYRLSSHFYRYKNILFGVLSFLVATHVIKSSLRNEDWKSEYSIFRSGLKITPANAKLWNNVGHALEARGQYKEALEYFHTAVRVQPDDIGAHINVGRTYNNLQKYSKAEAAYLKAKSLLPQAKPGQKYTTRIAPQHLSVFLNLGILISKDPKRLEEADSLYRQAISMRADYIQAYINRGDILIKLNRTSEAQEVYEKALMYESSNPDIFYNLGVVYIEQGKPQQALIFFDKALSIDPDHIQALMNSAILMQETGRPEYRPLAYERLFKVLENSPQSDRVYFNLGMLGMDDEDYEKAEAWFKKAIELKPDFRSALFNLALLLNERSRSLEAIPYLKTLLKYHDQHIKGLILLGDIYTNHVKDLSEAEKCYRRIIEIDPQHIQGRHNLCVVMVERGLLDEAEECLKKVMDLAPDLEYVARHLKIVQNRKSLLASRKVNNNNNNP